MCVDNKKLIEMIISKNEGDVDLTWSQINDILGLDYSADHTRKISYGVMIYHNLIKEKILDDYDFKDIDNKLIELKKERVKLNDLRAEINKQIRSQARHESMLECAREIAEKFNLEKPLFTNPPILKSTNKEAVLLLSDWHVGLVCENHWNKYNVEIAKERLSFLRQRVIDICLFGDIKKINVCCLGDLISGIIHNNLRLENREDVVTQSILVSEMIAEFLKGLSIFFHVDLYYVVGNHERISQSKSDSLDKENFGYFIFEMVKARCKDIDGLTIHDNEIDDEIISFEIFGKKIIATHGNNFGNLNNYVSKFTTMMGFVPDYVCIGHFHQHIENTFGVTELIVNPSFSGVDSYAKNYGLISKKGQKMMIFSKEYGKECSYNIEL
jgi:predicted phosphodiesterase